MITKALSEILGCGSESAISSPCNCSSFQGPKCLKCPSAKESNCLNCPSVDVPQVSSIVQVPKYLSKLSSQLLLCL